MTPNFDETAVLPAHVTDDAIGQQRGDMPEIQAADDIAGDSDMGLAQHVDEADDAPVAIETTSSRLAVYGGASPGEEGGIPKDNKTLTER